MLAKSLLFRVAVYFGSPYPTLSSDGKGERRAVVNGSRAGKIGARQTHASQDRLIFG